MQYLNRIFDLLVESYNSAYETMGPGINLILVVFIAIGVVAQWSLYEKCDKPGWACLIPVYNVIVFLHIVGRPTWQVLLFLIPVYNIIFFFQVFIEVCQCFGRTKWYDYLLVVLVNAPYIIFLGLSPDTDYKGPLHGENSFKKKEAEKRGNEAAKKATQPVNG